MDEVLAAALETSPFKTPPEGGEKAVPPSTEATPEVRA